MSIPQLPPFFDMKFVNDKGQLTKDGLLYNDQLSQALINILQLVNATIASQQDPATNANPNNYVAIGLVAPSYTTAQITAFEPNASVGTIWFNTTLSKLQVKTATSVVETITSV